MRGCACLRLRSASVFEPRYPLIYNRHPRALDTERVVEHHNIRSQLLVSPSPPPPTASSAPGQVATPGCPPCIPGEFRTDRSSSPLSQLSEPIGTSPCCPTDPPMSPPPLHHAMVSHPDWDQSSPGTFQTLPPSFARARGRSATQLCASRPSPSIPVRNSPLLSPRRKPPQLLHHLSLAA